MSDTVRNVQVKLKIAIDDSAPRAFQQIARIAARENAAVNKEVMAEQKRTHTDFAASIEKNYRRAGMLGQIGMGGTARSVAGYTGMAEGLGKAGFGGAGAALARGAVPLAIAGQVVGHVANMAQFAALAGHDRYSSEGQIGRSFVRQFVPGGERVQGMLDAFSGRAAGMEQAKINRDVGAAGVTSNLDTAGFNLGYNPQQAGREALAGAYRGQRAIAPSVFDRSGSSGERAYREEQRLIPLKQATAKAERDSAVASREHLASQIELTKLNAKSTELTEKRTRLQRAADEEGGVFGDSVKRQNLLYQVSNTNQELTGLASLRRQATQGVAGAAGSAVGARAEVQRAKARQELLGRADTLAEQGASAGNLARSLGGMNVFDRQFAANSLQMLRDNGPESLTPEMISAASQLDPEGVGKLLEKSGAASDEYKRLVQGITGTTGSPEEIRRREAEARRELAQKEFGIDTSAASGMAEAGRNVGRDIGNLIKETFEIMKNEIINTVKAGREPG